MHFRVGINLGDIIIRDDGTAYGDGVNVAARLEGLAAAGGVMISHTVYDHVGGRLEVGLVDAGEHKVKNIAKPVKAYRVLLDGSRPSLSTTHSRTDFRRPTLIAGLMGALVIVATAGGWWWFVGDKQSNSGDWPSLVVQPFESLSDDPDLASVAHALTTEVSNGLSLFPDLRVIPAGTNQSDTDYVLAATYNAVAKSSACPSNC